MFVELFTAGATGQTSPNYEVRSSESGTPYRHRQKVLLTMYVSGTFSGGTVALQAYDGVDWQPVTYYLTATAFQLAAAGMISTEFYAERVRAVITGGTASAMKVRLLTNAQMEKTATDIA